MLNILQNIYMFFMQNPHLLYLASVSCFISVPTGVHLDEKRRIKSSTAIWSPICPVFIRVSASTQDSTARRSSAREKYWHNDAFYRTMNSRMPMRSAATWTG